MFKKQFRSIRIRRKIRLWSLIIGLPAFFFLAQLQNKKNSESIDAIETESHISFISPEVASAIALNSFKEIESGVTLSHPNHSVHFEKEGVSFLPQKGPEWKWQLTHIGTETEALDGLPLKEVKPKNNHPRIVSYEYGNITEEYHAKQNTVEQRFVLDEPLPLEGQDLIIRGQVMTEGQFEELGEGWAWSDAEGQVKLGDVTVFDAEGHILMASMQVTAQSTEIIVDAHALATAIYPVTVDPEIGANDFRISDMGPDGSFSFSAVGPKVAYNSIDHEYLVAWYGADDISPLVVGEHEIFCQRIDAATGAELGANDFRISDMGPNGDDKFDAFTLAVTYNSTHNEYLIVWRGDDNTGSLVDNEFEIFGQLLAADGTEIGSDFRISDMGPDGDDGYDTFHVDVSHNSINNEYLVVWFGDDTIDDRFEVYGQLLDASGGEIGSDFLISDALSSEFKNLRALYPAVAYNSIDNQYLIVWENDILATPSTSSETEIFGQILNEDGSKIGINFRISDMGPGGSMFFKARLPDVAYNSTDNEYFVVWQGEDDIPPLVFGETEIFVQRLDNLGTEMGENDRRISDMGPDGNLSYDAHEPAITYNSIDNDYLVVWKGEDHLSPLAIDEVEIFGQHLDNLGAEVKENDFRISDVGPEGDKLTPAFQSAVTHNSIDNEYLVVWGGADNPLPPGNAEREVFGQRLSTGPSLTGKATTVSLSGASGPQTVAFTLNAGPENAFLPYIVLGSLSGKSPGTAIGDVYIPLNPDAYTLFTLTNLNSAILANNFGTLDKNGRATVSFSPPNNSNLIGLVATHAAFILDPQQFTQQVIVGATNAVDTDLEP